MKTPFYLICLASLAAGCGETKKSQGYQIGGKIKGVQSGMVKLSAYDAATKTSKVIDSGTISNGVFNLKGTIQSPEIVSLSLGDGYWSLSLFLENSDIKVEADTTGSEHFDYTAYGAGKGAMLKNFTVTGSTNEDQMKAFDNNPALHRYTEVQKAFSEAARNATSKEDGYKINEQWDSVNNLAMIARKNLIDSFANANPSSPASVYFFYNYFKFNESMPLADMESFMSKYTGPAQATVYFKELTKSLEQKKSLQPGQLAPDFTLLKRDSSQFTLSSLRGKYVMLDFWASWCVPCRKAIPHWKEVYKKYQPKGFEIVAVTNDSRWSDWFKALDEEKMPWTQVADEFPVKNMPSRIGTLYMTPYLPCYILLDKEGKIILHNPSKEQIDEKLKELLGA